jgi:amylosucrase
LLAIEHQITLAREHVLARLAGRAGVRAAPAAWLPFRARVERHFPALLGELSALYGERADFLAFLEELLAVAFEAWAARPDDLKALDVQRESQPLWFQSEQMLGGVCYVDLYAGNLKGIEASIPYFKELGLRYLHLMPLFLCPEGNSDGGYAVSSYREVNPALGTMADLKALAVALRREGISLVLDFIFNHTVREPARGAHRDPRLQRTGAHSGPGPAVQVRGHRAPGRRGQVHLARRVPGVLQPAADGAAVEFAGHARSEPAAARARIATRPRARHRVGELRAQPR